MADDIWCQYAPGIPEPRLCRRTFKKSDLQMQKTREEKVLSLRAKTGWCITMQNLVLKMKEFQNLCMEISCGIR